ncbi:MAG: sugar phosphate isomerase/epimerase [Candidatus Promineifilaceae bacterium]|nr:sugar phosphate isomerase/epimerase [Candidatus Promineifilaceae bacterium]
MRFLFSTGSLWPYGIERCFALAAAAGYDGLEIMVDQRWDTRQAGYLRSLCERFGLPVDAVHSPFWPSVPGWPAGHPGRIQASVQLAEAVGATVVVHHLPARVGHVTLLVGARMLRLPVPVWRRETAYRRWLEEAYEAVQAETEVRLCIENMPAYRRAGRRWNLYYWNEPEAMRRFPNVTMDTTHLGTWGLEPAEVYPRLNGRVGHVHLSNFDGREHRRPEVGELRLDRFLQRLAADGYGGAVSLELHPDALDAGEPDEAVIERMRTSLLHCRQWVEGV